MKINFKNPFIASLTIVLVTIIVMWLQNNRSTAENNETVFITAGTAILLNGLLQCLLLVMPDDISLLIPKVIASLAYPVVVINLVALFLTHAAWADLDFYRQILYTLVFAFVIMVIIIIAIRRIIEFAKENEH
ncbi:MAG TPA: hypothetical protein PK076_13180 [Saprospiraceae bacterium]|nr:hypothetical protein [Saprospiraceae bacterium]HQW57080.1 hypothetical protein [Saprospiraceae bacterium]